MELPAVLRASTSEGSEVVVAVTVLELGDGGCLIEASQPVELGDRVAVELAVAGERVEASGIVIASNELQLLYSIRFDDPPPLPSGGAR